MTISSLQIIKELHFYTTLDVITNLHVLYWGRLTNLIVPHQANICSPSHHSIIRHWFCVTNVDQFHCGLYQIYMDLLWYFPTKILEVRSYCVQYKDGLQPLTLSCWNGFCIRRRLLWYQFHLPCPSYSLPIFPLWVTPIYNGFRQMSLWVSSNWSVTSIC